MNTSHAIVILLMVTSASCQRSTAQKQLEKFSAAVGCSSTDSLCANSTIDRSFSVRSETQCIHECQHGGERSACVGVNYRQDANVCEVYNRCPASYNVNVTGCQYLQRETMASQKNCSAHINCDKPSAYVIPGTGDVQSVVTYNDELFVGRRGTVVITIYDSATFQPKRNITIVGCEIYIQVMALSQANNLLYVGDCVNAVVRAVSMPLTTATDNITPSCSFAVTYRPQGLSVNRANNVLVAMTNYIEEYTSSGVFVRQISTSSTDNAHGVEQLNGLIAVSSFFGLHAVRLMSTSGTVLKTYGSNTTGSGTGYLSGPRELAVDKDGYILVCDLFNSRVLVMDPTLSEARELPTIATGIINRPMSILLDQSKGRLYVGESTLPCRVLVFTNMFNIAEAFASMKPV